MKLKKLNLNKLETIKVPRREGDEREDIRLRILKRLVAKGHTEQAERMLTRLQGNLGKHPRFNWLNDLVQK